MTTITLYTHPGCVDCQAAGQAMVTRPWLGYCLVMASPWLGHG